MSSESRRSITFRALLIFSMVYLLRQIGCDIPPSFMPSARSVIRDPIPIHLEPEQGSAELLNPIRKMVRGKEYSLTPMATFRISARVVSQQRYYVTNQNFLSPVDLALAWGSLASPAALDEVEYTQGGRFLTYHPKPGGSFTIDEIYPHTANIHIIPSDSRMEAVAKNISVGDAVILEGYLVNVSAPDGFKWNTSLVRTDRGTGACEVLYLARARVNQKQF